MNVLFKCMTSVLAVMLFVLFINSCGKKDTTTDTKTSDTKTTDTKGSGDIDGMIDNYETMMKEYVVIVKKVKEGDVSQSGKMQELLTKTQEWSKKLADAAPKLSVEQSQRIANISKTAADEMAK